jgi:hypothetical protein
LKQVERVKPFDDDDFSVALAVPSRKVMYSPRGGILNALSFGSARSPARKSHGKMLATVVDRLGMLQPLRQGGIPI